MRTNATNCDGVKTVEWLPSRPELERFFFLDNMDRDLIALRRTPQHQLGGGYAWRRVR